jgi:hypothetical protein
MEFSELTRMNRRQAFEELDGCPEYDWRSPEHRQLAIGSAGKVGAMMVLCDDFLGRLTRKG